MKLSKALLWGFLILGFLSLHSCSSTKTELTAIWEDDTFEEPPFKKILVVGLAKKESVRRSFEEDFAKQLQKRGTEAISSAQVLPPDQKIEKEVIKSSIEGTGIDAVIVSRLLSVEDQDDIVPGETRLVPHTYYDHLYRHYVSTYQEVEIPPSVLEQKVISIETNLYSVEFEKLVYSAVTETFDPATTDDVIQSLSRVVVEDLREAHFIE